MCLGAFLRPQPDLPHPHEVDYLGLAIWVVQPDCGFGKTFVKEEVAAFCQRVGGLGQHVGLEVDLLDQEDLELVF